MILAICMLLLIPLSLGCWRVYSGPTMADRLLGIQLIGTVVISLLLVFSKWLQQPALLDVALLLSLLAAAMIAALVQRLRRADYD